MFRCLTITTHHCHLYPVSVQLGAGEHPGGASQPQQPAGDMGAAPGGVRHQHREILCQLPSGRRREHRPLRIPDGWRPGCGEFLLLCQKCLFTGLNEPVWAGGAGSLKAWHTLSLSAISHYHDWNVQMNKMCYYYNEKPSELKYGPCLSTFSFYS